MKNMWLPWKKWMTIFIHSTKDIKKRQIGLKTKVKSFPGRNWAKKGAQVLPVTQSTLQLGILSFESELLSGCNANTGSIVILQRGRPTCTAFYPPGASVGLTHWAVTPAAGPEGLYPRWCLEICADLLHKKRRVNPFAVPQEMSSQG